MSQSSSSLKRSATDFECTKPNKKKKGHWSQGLLGSVNDPSLFVEKDEKLVIIKDKYPKARHHFLVLPHESIHDLKALKSDHTSLLRHMERRAKNLAGNYPESLFRYGYHAIPSMSQLHLHAVSQDFDSPCLKTKRHWNSFNTSYFIESAEVIRCLEESGHVSPITPLEGRKLLEEPLKCCKCSHSPQNMPKLKQHLLTHKI